MNRLQRLSLPMILICALIFSSAATAPAAKSAANAYQNGSLIVEDDTYLYYAGESGGPLYRQKKSDPKSIKLLADGDVTSLAKQGEWLYFFERTRKMMDSGIYKMKTDGTGKKRISDWWVKAISVQGDSIYYLSELGGLFKLSNDGKKLQTIHEVTYRDDSIAGDLYIADGWIYYSIISDKKGIGGIYKVQVGSTKRKKLSNSTANRLFVLGGWLYGQDDANQAVYRMGTDGSAYTKLADGTNLSFSGDQLYWVKPEGRGDSDFALYRMSGDGSGVTRVSMLAGKARGVKAIGERIYYYIYGSPEQFSMRKDGSDWRRTDGKPILLKTAGQLLEARQKKISYSLDQKDASARKLDISVGKALELVPKIVREDMTDDEKLKAIHDYVVLNTAYDYDNYLKDTVPDDSYREYGVLNNGIAVCNGYALAMKLLLDAAGLESYYVAGVVTKENKETGQKTSEGHAWNVVKIGDSYYQVDATWDDPVPNRDGYVRYDYYKVTDEFMKQSRSWDANQAPAAV